MKNLFRTFYDDFDAHLLTEPYRSVLSETVVPRLLGWLREEGLDVVVSSDLKASALYGALHNRDPLLHPMPFTDPECHPDADESNAICVYLTRADQLVGRICARLFWVEESLGQSLEDLSLLYSDPNTMAVPGEIVIAKARPAWDFVRGWVVVMTGGHVIKELRKTGAYDALQRLCRAKTLSSWRWDYTVALIEPDKSGKLGFPRYGHQMAAPGVYFVHGPTVHAFDLLISDRPYLRSLICRAETADMTRPVLALTDGEIDRALAKRRGAC